jgi:hypothetical protein
MLASVLKAETPLALMICSIVSEYGAFAYEGTLFHDCRRSAVRNLERAGVPRSVAMKITGHKTESVYRRCAIVSEADPSDAVQRLEGQLTPQLTPAPQARQDEHAKVN